MLSLHLAEIIYLVEAFTYCLVETKLITYKYWILWLSGMLKQLIAKESNMCTMYNLTTTISSLRIVRET
jgi:hypothetical protein